MFVSKFVFDLLFTCPMKIDGIMLLARWVILGYFSTSVFGSMTCGEENKLISSTPVVSLLKYRKMVE